MGLKLGLPFRLNAMDFVRRMERETDRLDMPRNTQKSPYSSYDNIGMSMMIDWL